MAEKRPQNPRKIILAKIVIFVVASLAILGANFWWEHTRTDAEASVVSEVGDFKFEGENVLESDAVMRFYEGSNSSGEYFALEEGDMWRLDSGRIWADFSGTLDPANIIVQNIILVPNRARFDLSIEDGSLKLLVYSGDMFLGFLEELPAEEALFDKYDVNFMNRFLVPQDTKVTINLKKIDERIAPLLYSKLAKELKHTVITANDRDTEWVRANLKAGEKRIDNQQQELTTKVMRKGPSFSEGAFGDFLLVLERSLTFVPEKENKKALARTFSIIDDAFFRAFSGDFDLMKQRMQQFDSERSRLGAELLKSAEFLEAMDGYLEKMSAFGPGDDKYQLFVELFDRQFKENTNRHQLMEMIWYDVYKAIDEGGIFPEQALNLFYQYFDQTLGDYQDINEYRLYIDAYNQLFDNLFLRYPVFYHDRYFAIKNILENEALGLYESGQFKSELSQAFVSKKIDFLKRLRSFFFDPKQEISVEDAKEILSRLVEEVDDLVILQSSDVAVAEIFEAELEDIGDFWGYLNSSEYNSSSIYGSSHEERYESYLEERDQIWSFVDIQSDVLGEEFTEELTEADIVEDVLAQFERYEEFEEIEVGEIKEANQRYVMVGGVIDGFPFQAEYDRYYNVLNQVYSYDDLISDRAVKLSSMADLLKGRFADLVEENPEEEVPVDEETNAQRIARIYIQGLLEDLGFELEIGNVEILDDLNTVYRVTDIILADYAHIQVTFDYAASLEKASSVILRVEGASEPLFIKGEFDLDQIESLIIAEDQRQNPPEQPEKVTR